MTLIYKDAPQSYAQPIVLSCKACDFTRVLDDYHQAKGRAELHVKLSKHYDFDLTTCERSMGSLHPNAGISDRKIR